MIETRDLQNYALFGGLTADQLDVVIPHLREARFAAGAWIMRQGDAGDRLYFIRAGQVRVMREGDRPVVLAVMHAGDAFGEMELIDTQPRSASIQAVTDLETYYLTNRELHRLHRERLDVFAMIILNLARELSRRLRDLNPRVAW